MKILWKMEHLLQKSKYSIFHNIFKTMIFQRQHKALLWSSDFIWDFGKLHFPEHLGKYFIKFGKISAKIHEIGKIKAIFGLGMITL